MFDSLCRLTDSSTTPTQTGAHGNDQAVAEISPRPSPAPRWSWWSATTTGSTTPAREPDASSSTPGWSCSTTPATARTTNPPRWRTTWPTPPSPGPAASPDRRLLPQLLTQPDAGHRRPLDQPWLPPGYEQNSWVEVRAVLRHL